jgi:hypothetical protein
VVVAAAAVLIATSTAFAADVWHVVMLLFVVVPVAAVVALAWIGLQFRRVPTWRPPVSGPRAVRRLDRRVSRPDMPAGTTGPRRVGAPRVVPGEVLGSRRTPRAELGREGGR